MVLKGRRRAGFWARDLHCGVWVFTRRRKKMKKVFYDAVFISVVFCFFLSLTPLFLYSFVTFPPTICVYCSSYMISSLCIFHIWYPPCVSLPHHVFPKGCLRVSAKWHERILPQSVVSPVDQYPNDKSPHSALSEWILCISTPKFPSSLCVAHSAYVYIYMVPV